MKFAVSVFALLGVALLAGCQPTQPSEPTLPNQPSVVVKNDTQAFKTEYESLNAEKMPITVPEDLNISVLDFSGTKEFLEKGTPRRDIKIAVHDYKVFHNKEVTEPIQPDYWCRKHDIHSDKDIQWIHYLSHELTGLTPEELEKYYYTPYPELREIFKGIL